MNKLRHGKVKQLSQSHTASKRWSWDSTSNRAGAELILLTSMIYTALLKFVFEKPFVGLVAWILKCPIPMVGRLSYPIAVLGKAILIFFTFTKHSLPALC